MTNARAVAANVNALITNDSPMVDKMNLLITDDNPLLDMLNLRLNTMLQLFRNHFSQVSMERSSQNNMNPVLTILTDGEANKQIIRVTHSHVKVSL